MQGVHHECADHSMLLLPQVPAAGSEAYDDRGVRRQESAIAAVGIA
jgi:hypothetical protein